jgi:hypothetical protein
MTTIRPLSTDALRSSQPTVAEKHGASISVGETDLRDYVDRYSLSFEDDGRTPKADIHLRSANIPPIDYFATLNIIRFRGEVRTPSFGGAIMMVDRDEEGLAVTASAMADFRELAVSPHASVRVDGVDLIHLLARTAGLEEDKVRIDVGGPPMLETIEVAVPISGCTVDTPVVLSDTVRLVSKAAVNLEQFRGNASITSVLDDFENCDAVAVTYVTDEHRLFSAEEKGVARVRAALEWFTVQLRNGFSHAPNGKARPFAREQARTALGLRDTVLVTGLLSGRTWLRDTSVPMAKHQLAGSKLSSMSATLPLTDGPSVLSYTALARAGNESLESMSRVTALWDALEFYAAGVEVDRVFSKSEMRALRKRSVEGLNEEQVRRLDQGFQQLNASSLLQRIWIKAASDAVPISASDRDIIVRMREVRNDAIHGRNLRPPPREELAHAVSVVARLLVFAAHSKGSGSLQ